MTGMSIVDKIDKNRLPRHVAIIMDGNGRWAKQRNMDRSQGHIEGVNTVRKITEIASEIGIGYLTLYTFSTENWNRPREEVDALMNLIVVAIERETPDLIKNNVRLTMIAGRILYENGEFFVGDDPEHIYAEAERCTKELIGNDA